MACPCVCTSPSICKTHTCCIVSWCILPCHSVTAVVSPAVTATLTAHCPSQLETQTVTDIRLHTPVPCSHTFHKAAAYTVSHCRLVSSLHTSSLCRHFVIVSLCDWSLYSSACQSREQMFPLKVIKSDRGSLLGEQKWPWEVSDTLSPTWRGFLPVCLSVCARHCLSYLLWPL